MGALDQGQFSLEIENGCVELGFEEEAETLSIEKAVRILLQGLGEDVNREGLRKTPLRVAKALREGTRGYRLKAKDIVHSALFPESGLENGVGHAGGLGGLVIVRDLDLFSYCERCLLPFRVKCHVGYVPSEHRVVGLSKLSRVVDTFAKRLQDPRRLADEVCKALQHGMAPAGVAVFAQCFHIQVPNFESGFLDVNCNGWTKISVSSGSGVFEDEKADVWSDFQTLLQLRNMNLSEAHNIVNASLDQSSWCPMHFSSKMVPEDPSMVDSVASIIRTLGENPLREELVETPGSFVSWLMNFKNFNLEMNLNKSVGNHKDSSQKPNGLISQSLENIHTELNISFLSQCEHHLLPFHGFVHIGYLSKNQTNQSERSSLHSIVHFYGFKLQVQERLTRQIAETASSFLGEEDVIVVVEAQHTCMISRGIEKFGSNTATVAVLGRFSTDHTLRASFLRIIPNYRDIEE